MSVGMGAGCPPAWEVVLGGLVDSLGLAKKGTKTAASPFFPANARSNHTSGYTKSTPSPSTKLASPAFRVQAHRLVSGTLRAALRERVQSCGCWLAHLGVQDSQNLVF